MAKKNTAASKPKSRASSQKSSGFLPPSVAQKISVPVKQIAPPKSAPKGGRSVAVARWVGTGQLALRCGLTSQTIRNDIERGKIIAHQTGSGRYVISRAEVERYLIENGFASNSSN
jgi:excisionase family DNA binding protein